MSPSNSGQATEGQGSGKRQRGDNWICKACGNSNFAFRDRCNMRVCGVERGADGPAGAQSATGDAGNFPRSRPGGPTSFPPPLSNMNPGAIQSMNAGLMGNMGGIYPGAFGGVDPAALLQLMATLGMVNMTGYTPLTAFQNTAAMDVMNNGFGGYGGLGMGLPQNNLGAYGGGEYGMPPNTESRKRRGGPADDSYGSRDSSGDWFCVCGNKNFAHRQFCNLRKCGLPKPKELESPRRPPREEPRKEDPPPDGSWKCSCGNVNYPHRTACNRRHCGLPKPADAPGNLS